MYFVGNCCIVFMISSSSRSFVLYGVLYFFCSVLMYRLNCVVLNLFSGLLVFVLIKLLCLLRMRFFV